MFSLCKTYDSAIGGCEILLFIGSVNFQDVEAKCYLAVLEPA
jgi:hypothetical protein